jgi:lipid-binding SYLF domain-containing protein
VRPSDPTCVTRTVAALLVAFALTAGCRTAPASQEGKDDLVRQAVAALKEWDTAVPGLEGFARQSHGYAVFPGIAKGGLGLGAAYGRGVVYEQGQHIGYADLSHLSLGLQVGGQAYQVLMAFGSRAVLERFTRGQLDFSADASGVLFTAGYVANVRFDQGVTVFSRPIGGAMGEAVSMGGQRITFVFREDREPDRRLLPAAGTR